MTLRIMVIQDRNYTNFSSTPSAGEMYTNIFGITPQTGAATASNYVTVADCTLLPINPLEPGRYNVIRDFQMNVASGWRQDYYKKVLIKQRDFNSKGRIYFG